MNGDFSSTTQGRGYFVQLPRARQWFSGVVLGQQQQQHLGTLEMQLSGSSPNLLNQTLKAGPAMCFNNPPGVYSVKVGKSLS